jgi:hypothetical protein
MPRQKNSEPHVVIRRRKVASMLLRRMNALELTELTEALSQGRNATFNPHTKQPYSHPTITRDINALLDRWQEEARDDFAQMKGKHLSEVREAKRAAC